MLKEVNNEVTASTVQKEQAASQQDKVLKGRQVVWLIFTFFKRNPKMGVFYSVTDLAKLDWLGDKNIHIFFDDLENDDFSDADDSASWRID